MLTDFTIYLGYGRECSDGELESVNLGVFHVETTDIAAAAGLAVRFARIVADDAGIRRDAVEVDVRPGTPGSFDEGWVA